MVRKKTHLLEHIAAQAVRLVEDEHGAGARFGAEAGHLVLDLAVEGGAASFDAEPHLPRDRFVEVHRISRRERDVEDLVETRVQARGHRTHRAALSAARIAGHEADAVHVDEVPEARRDLAHLRGDEELFGRELLVEGEARESEVFQVHGSPSLLSPAMSLMRSAIGGGALAPPCGS